MSDDARALLGFAIDLVDCGLDILRNHITSDAQLKHQSALIPGGTLGKHFRHVAETYDAFLSTLKGDPYGGPPAIDYDAILPDTRKTTAGSLEACTTAMQRVRDGLVALGEVEDLDGKFELTVDVVAITPARQEMKSTLGRELWFCSLHAVHHYAMVRVIAVHELGVSLPVEFGTAPSTILYRGKDWKPPATSIPPALKAKL